MINVCNHRLKVWKFCKPRGFLVTSLSRICLFESCKRLYRIITQILPFITALDIDSSFPTNLSLHPPLSTIPYLASFIRDLERRGRGAFKNFLTLMFHLVRWLAVLLLHQLQDQGFPLADSLLVKYHKMCVVFSVHYYTIPQCPVYIIIDTITVNHNP